MATGKAQGKGPVGFSAAMLPFLQNRDAQAVQRQRVADNFPGSDAYYNYVLTLFGQGWDQHRFRFSTKVSYYLTGARNAQIHTKHIHAFPVWPSCRWSRQHQPLSNSCWSKFG